MTYVENDFHYEISISRCPDAAQPLLQNIPFHHTFELMLKLRKSMVRRTQTSFACVVSAGIG